MSSGGGLLLDTHAFLWVLADDSRLGPSSRAALRAGAAVYYSSVTILELTIKDMLGRLDLPGKPVAFQVTDTFLRVFGLGSLADLPPLHGEAAESAEPEETEGDDGQLEWK